LRIDKDLPALLGDMVMKAWIAAATGIVLCATPAAADRGGRRSLPGPVWYPGGGFPSPIERYGKGVKGMKRYQRALEREEDFRRFQEDRAAFRGAASGMEDARARCDRRLKAALEGSDQAEIEEAREFCRPKAYGPQLR
jgi:hypothetical protein